MDVEQSERAYEEWQKMNDESPMTVAAAEAFMGTGSAFLQVRAVNPYNDDTILPTGYEERKELKMYDFMFHYFPLAWLEIVKVAVAGNNQHNPGETLHWAREKSKDQMNTAFRHIFDYGTGTKYDTDGRTHLGKAAWRLMAQLQLDLEAERL